MSTDLDRIVNITISRDTQTASRASFGIPAILSEFTTGKTTLAFVRHRFYASLTEMLADGWLVSNPEHKAAQILFNQSPKVEKVMIGRRDATDTTWAVAAAEIQKANDDWYTSMIIAHDELKFTFDADFVASNSIVFTINGTAVTAVPFNTSQILTMGDIKTQIEADITNSAVTLSTDDPDDRTLTVKVDGKTPTGSVIVTLGASQPVASVTVSTTKVVFSADFVASNSIVFTINGTAVTAVPFNTTHAQTMTDLKSQIETDITDCVVTIDDSDANTRTLLIDIDKDISSVAVAVTGGASQPTSTITTNLTDVYKEIAAWIETEKKLFFYCSSLDDIKSALTTDIHSFMNAQNYDRTISQYHTASQGDETPAWFELGWPGEALPFDTGSQTWMFKTITGITVDALTSSERDNILGKKGNIYTEVGSKDITQDGTVASGEFIDIMRGTDKLESDMQADVFDLLSSVGNRKIGFTDEGINKVVNVVLGALKKEERSGLLVVDGSVVTAPKAVDVSTANKSNRLLPDIKFTATYQGAIHKTTISGIITV